jgi:hypothetical protein
MMNRMVMTSPTGGAKPSLLPAAWMLLPSPLFWGLFAAFVAFALAGERFAWLTAGAFYGVSVLAILRTIWAFVGSRQDLRRRAPLRLNGLLSDRTTAAALLGLATYVSLAGMLASASNLSGSHAFLAAQDASLLALLGLVFLRFAGAALASVAAGERLVRAALGRVGRS